MRTERGNRRRVLVVGDDPVGPVVARHLSGDVLFRAFDGRISRRVAGDVRDAATLDEVGQWSPPAGVDAAVVATADDSTNLLTAQRLRAASDAEILVRLNDPTRREVYTALDVETVCAATNLGESLARQYPKIVE